MAPTDGAKKPVFLMENESRDDFHSLKPSIGMKKLFFPFYRIVFCQDSILKRKISSENVQFPRNKRCNFIFLTRIPLGKNEFTIFFS